jgi:hypothetical protein
MRNAYKILVGKPEANTPRGRYMSGRMTLKPIHYGERLLIRLNQKHFNKYEGSKKGGALFHQLNDYQFHKQDSVPYNKLCSLYLEYILFQLPFSIFKFQNDAEDYNSEPHIHMVFIQCTSAEYLQRYRL